MPLQRVNNLMVVEPDYIYREKYWPQLSEFVKNKVGENELKSPEEVQDILKECFSILCVQFMQVIKKVPKASFFVFVQDLHEDSIEIWRIQLTNPPFQINQEEFAGSRRVMKYILEQACGLELSGCPNFLDEIAENVEEYTAHLDELIYIGSWAFALSEYIARSQICPSSISIKVVENVLNIFVNTPFNSIFEYIFHDKDRHKDSIVVSDSALGLRRTLTEDLNVSYDLLCSAIYEPVRRSNLKYTIFRLNELMDYLESEHHYSRAIMEVFYSGLMITEENVLTIEDCILKTQDERRHTFRPILRYRIDGDFFWLIGGHKWSESLVQLTTNCIPFGLFPKEWMRLKPLKRFLTEISNTHDRILEDPIIDIIKGHDFKFDRNVTSIKKANNQNISLEKKSVGEFDIIFIDEDEKVLFLVECKHNRSRYEFFNWRRDISNFRTTYENQLNNKFNWVKNNKIVVLEHFEVVYGSNISNKETYQIIPLFVINAPTLYMYDSAFKTFTIHDFKLFLNQELQKMEFNGELNGVAINIAHPFFQNAETLVQKNQSTPM